MGNEKYSQVASFLVSKIKGMNSPARFLRGHSRATKSNVRRKLLVSVFTYPLLQALEKGHLFSFTKTCIFGTISTTLTLISSNAQEQCWVWNNDGIEYFYDKYEWVRVRVEQEQWHDQSPVAPAERESVAAQERISPFSITVCASIALRADMLIQR